MIIVASNFITETATRPAVLISVRVDNDCFLYMSLPLFAMHKPRLHAFSDYISDEFDSLDPWPQHYSCSFRLKWLELIVHWGSSCNLSAGYIIIEILIIIFWHILDHFSWPTFESCSSFFFSKNNPLWLPCCLRFRDAQICFLYFWTKSNLDKYIAQLY